MTRRFLIILFLLSTVFAVGQDTIYFDSEWNVVSSNKNASFYEIVLQDHVDNNRATETTYFKSGQIKMLKNYSDYKDRKLDGKLKEWYESGQLNKEIDYNDGKINGNLITYWDNGMHKRIDTYNNGMFIDGMCFNSDGAEIVHFDYRIKPEFPGGEDEFWQYILSEIKYPAIARENGIQGQVIVSFVVNKNGTLYDVKIDESVSDELDEEALRVVYKMPMFIPGMVDGEVARTTVKLPIRFRLE